MSVSLGNVIRLPTKRKPQGRETDAGVTVTFPLAAVEQVRECLLRLQVAAELALMTLDGVVTHGPAVALSGVASIFTALQGMPPP